MINIFYGYGAVWSLVLILYLLKWSNLCTPLNISLLLFIIFGILFSYFIGFFMRKKMKFYKLTENPHKKSTVTKIFLLLFILEIIYEKEIPLFGVITGSSYSTISFTGLPNLHVLISSAAIFYSFYLSYIFSCFKQKKVLLENCLIISYFILLVQRQNILVCLLMFVNNLYACNSEYFAKKIKSGRNKMFLLVLVSIFLYGFGVFGNIRYGSSWQWNDSSMIQKLGRINENYPSFLPKEYSWSYVYLVSPLVNLNYNIDNVNTNDDAYKYMMEYVPEFLRNNFFDYEKELTLLPVSSLTASTSYVRVYKYGGYLGMYAMLFVQLILSAIVALGAYKNRKNYFVVVCNGLTYFLLFSFFTNTFVYSITGMILLISILCSTKIKKIVVRW